MLFSELQETAARDTLTGLYNRRLFEEQFEAAVARSLRADEDLALLIVDLDGLKRINDVSGHVAGDQALGTLADALRATIRATDVACRLGGDEFGIILPGSTAEDAVKVAERAQETLAQIGHGQYSFSGGIARVTAHQSSAENVYRSADLAAYRAKAAGGAHPPRDRDEGGGGSLASSSYSRCCMGEGNGGRGSSGGDPRPGGLGQAARSRARGARRLVAAVGAHILGDVAKLEQGLAYAAGAPSIRRSSRSPIGQRRSPPR